jgi:ABC-type sugar transport system ATPase subunit
MATLQLEHVYKNYGEVKAVIDANWECADGEIVSILGPSGCGKSSSLRMIAGLEGITGGSIYIGGKRVNHLKPAERNIAMAFENYALYPHMTVRQNIAYPLKIRKVASEVIQQRCSRILEMLELADIADHQVTGLSGGQKQRVSLGRALIREPEVFLLDEPISHLDAKLRSKMRCDLKNLLKRTGNTAVYVTHDQLEAITVADRIVVMNFGAVQQIGTPLEIYENPQNKFVATFIGEPAMNMISGKLDQEGRKTYLVIGDQRIEIPVQTLESSGRRETGLSIGIRPNECFISLEERSGWLRGSIYTITSQIDSAIYQVDLGEPRATSIHVVAERDTGGRIGDPAWVAFDDAKMRFYSDSDGLRIDGSGH